MTYAHYTALEQHRSDLNLHLRGFARHTSKSLAAVASMCSSRVDNRLTVTPLSKCLADNLNLNP